MAYRFFDEVLVEHINKSNDKSAVNIGFVNDSVNEIRTEFGEVAQQIAEAIKNITAAHVWLKPIKDGPVFLTYPVDGSGWYIQKEEDMSYLVRHIGEGVDYILVPEVDEWVVFNNKFDYVTQDGLNDAIDSHNVFYNAHDGIVGKVANIENQLKNISATKKLLNQSVANGTYTYNFNPVMKDNKYVIHVFNASTGDLLFPKITKNPSNFVLNFTEGLPVIVPNIDIVIIE